MTNRLIQFQCQREGTIFYYQTSLRRIPFVLHCPICKSKRTKETGRTYAAVDEMTALDK